MDTSYPIRAFGDVSTMLRDYVMERARRCFARTAAEKAALTSIEQVRARQAHLRQAFLAAVGGLPARASSPELLWGPLRERRGYSVQNVMCATAPRVMVTGTLWRPMGWDGPRPGLLFPCGHTEAPREDPDYQHVCAWFAVNGYVALAFDPPGQGEQKLCWDPVLAASFAGHGSAEHQHCGLQCELVGHNIARYFVQQGMAACDLLGGLPEVDPARIAVTGYSGGGTQSSYLMLADERLAAGMPCVYTTAREIYMQRPHWHDEEQNLTGALLAGLDYDDFYTCFAPRPAMIGAAKGDFFPIEGTRLAYERMRQVYGLFGAEDRVALCEVEGTNALHLSLQRASIEFFNRFLQPEIGLCELVDFEPETPETQRNTPSGQVSISVAGAKLVHGQNAEAVLASRAGRRAPTPAELAGLLGLPAEPCPLNPRVLPLSPSPPAEEGVGLEKAFITTEPDIVVPVLRLTGPHPDRVLVYCCDGGTASIDAPTERLLRVLARQGVAVVLADLRGLGETASQVGPSMLHEIWIPQYLRMLGTSMGALRAYDLVRVAQYARECGAGLPVTLMARGMVAWSAALAAALDGGIHSLCLHELRPSIEQFALEPTAVVPHAYAIPGILGLADLPQLVQSAGVERALVLEPTDCFGRPVTGAQWDEHYSAAWRDAVPELQVECRLDSLGRHRALASFLLG